MLISYFLAPATYASSLKLIFAPAFQSSQFHHYLPQQEGFVMRFAN